MTTLRRTPRLGLVASSGLRCSHRTPNKGGVWAAASQEEFFKRFWTSMEFSIDWKSVQRSTLPILKWFTARTNGSSILIRSPGLAWSYYRSDPEWGRIQANQLTQDLENLMAPLDVRVQHAEGMIEIVPRRLRKGTAMNHRTTSSGRLTYETGLRSFVLFWGSSLDKRVMSSFYSCIPKHAASHETSRLFSCALSQQLSPATCWCDNMEVRHTLFDV